MAVVVHVPDVVVLDELESRLKAIPVEFDLIVTNASGKAIRRERDGLPNLRNLAVFEVTDQGRDIFALTQVVNAGILDPYDLVLKIQPERPPLVQKAAAHAHEVDEESPTTDGVLGSVERVTRILESFATDSTLGIVTAPGNIGGPELWGASAGLTGELLRRVEFEGRLDALSFAIVSTYWARGFVLQGLRALNLTSNDFEPSAHRSNSATADAVQRAIGLLTSEAGLVIREATSLPEVQGDEWKRYQRAARRSPTVRFYPFYLPQFHPISENDAWWGKGFTEWTGVAAARPVYQGHHQPKLPAELGFYDLRSDEIRLAQASLATEHGISGFMYYYYWFAGKRLLDIPIERFLASDTQVAFCIMWANENWTRRWDGGSKEILIAQDYERAPAERFIEDVLHLLRDQRYIRIDGRPLLAVYHPSEIPNLANVLETWRRRAREEAVGELLLLAVDVSEDGGGVGAAFGELGFDGTLGFPPHLAPYTHGPVWNLGIHPLFDGTVHSYSATVQCAVDELRELPDRSIPGVMVNFDNTARRQWQAEIWYGSNPYTFRRWLAHSAKAVSRRPPQERIVFINAWNEWAEGAMLEPNDRFGRTYLQAVRDVAFS